MPLSKQIVAWKVFKYSNYRLFFPHWTLDGTYSPGTCEVPLNQWLTAKRVSAPTYHHVPYETGFHVCDTIEDAERWTQLLPERIILPVLVTDIISKYVHSPENRYAEEESVSGSIAGKMFVSSDFINLLR